MDKMYKICDAVTEVAKYKTDTGCRSLREYLLNYSDKRILTITYRYIKYTKKGKNKYANYGI